MPRNRGSLEGTDFSVKGDVFSLTTQGFDNLDKVLESFNSEDALKMIRAGLRAASKPVLKSAKANAPVISNEDIPRAGSREIVPGQLRDGLHLKQLPVSKLRKNVIVLLSVAKEDWYARILEFGQGQLQGRKMEFMRPAADNNKNTVLQLYKIELAKRINSFVKRKRGGR